MLYNTKKRSKLPMLPSFVVIGASQSGTTSLYNHLKAHPSVFMPDKKESRFFSEIKLSLNTLEGQLREGLQTKTLKEYKKLFEKADSAKVVGDNSPDYLFYHQKSVKSIIEILGKDTKIIIILRNPIERAYSLYLKYIKREFPLLSFEDALKKEGKYGDMGWYSHYPKRSGLYYEQVKAFLDNFTSVKIYLTEELKTDPDALMKDLYEFIGVDPSARADFKKRYNAYAGSPSLLYSLYSLYRRRFKILEKSFSLLRLVVPSRLREKMKFNVAKPEMKPEMRNYLKSYYYEDIQNLEKLIKKDLSGFLR